VPSETLLEFRLEQPCGKLPANALGVERGFSFLERMQFTLGNDELSEPTVQTNQNVLANVNRGEFHSFWVGQAGCQLPVELLKVFGLANLTRHFHSKPPLPAVGNVPTGCFELSS
jgi:hypothetical protein